MKEIIMAESAGFCFGIRRAVKIASETADKEQSCYCLGEITHNRAVVRELEEKGMITASGTGEIPGGATVVIRAHGTGKDVFEYLESIDAKIIDATCPKVSHIHKIVAEAEKRGRFPVIIGSKNHPEVLGVRGWCQASRIFEDETELGNWLKSDSFCPETPLTIVFQTTQLTDKVFKCEKIAKKQCTNVEIFDTICDATSIRQNEAKKLSSICDAMIVIGDSHSANSRHLAEICRLHCGNVQFIEGLDDLQIHTFDGVDTLGITAGASVPAWIIKEVKQKMFDEMNEEKNQEQVTETAEQATQAPPDMPAANTEENPAVPVSGEEPTPEVTAEKPESEMTFAEMLEDSIKTIYNGETVTGIVAAVTPTEISVDLGTKHSGYIPLSEFTDNPDIDITKDIAVGSKIEASVVRVNDVEGTVMLSKKRLDAVKHWADIEKAQEDGTIMEGIVTEDNKGGVVVSVKGVRVFVPASQTGLGKEVPMTELLKKNVRLKITEVNRSRRRVVGSIRAVIYAERKEKAEKIWSEIEIGKRYPGVVKSLTSYGAFVDIGGIDGMVHVSELSWGRVRQPSEVVSIGDEIEVYVINFDKETRKISLGYKDPDGNPWKQFKDAYEVGSVTNVKIVKLMPFGAFAEVIPGVDGLIHISQISNKRIGKPDDVLSVDEVVEVKITNIDDEKQKVSLSIRALTEPEQVPQRQSQERSESRPREEYTPSYSAPSAREDALVYEVSADGEVSGMSPEV